MRAAREEGVRGAVGIGDWTGCGQISVLEDGLAFFVVSDCFIMKGRLVGQHLGVERSIWIRIP